MDSSIIGTIITSYLTWDEFKKAAGDPLAWDAALSAWAPADGRVVSNSRFNAITQKTNVPDYRGTFLRCNNVIDIGNTAVIPAGQADPDGTRSLNTLQNDNFASHSHSYMAYNLVADGGTGFSGTGFSSNSNAGNGLVNSSAVGGFETRPKNYAVYFYIRIN